MALNKLMLQKGPSPVVSVKTFLMSSWALKLKVHFSMFGHSMSQKGGSGVPPG